MSEEQNQGDRRRRSTDEFDTSMLQTETPSARRWSTVFLVTGSALLGATAIAFLNRRTIASLRSRLSSGQPIRSARTDDEII